MAIDDRESHIMHVKKKHRYSRRRQQVRRQFLILAGVILLVVLLIVSCAVKGHKKKADAVKSIEASQQKTPDSKKEQKETEEEKLSRIKKEAKKAGYPEAVIALLSKNPETADFVENYGTKKSLPAATTIGNEEEITISGGIPQLLQWDERWGYSSYGTSIVAVSGCGPTCMAMVISGLTGDNTITPAVMADYGTEHGYVDDENNTYWAFMREASVNWGISCREIGTSEEEIAAVLSNKQPIICSVGPGDFTQSGHFIVLTSYSNGMVTVCDPFSQENSDKTWVYEDIKGQIKAMWVYSK